MGHFDFTRPFSTEFRNRLTRMQERILELEQTVADLSGEIETIGPPAPQPFWAILRCARKLETPDPLENQWEYGWEEFVPDDIHQVDFEVRLSGELTGPQLEGELRSSNVMVDPSAPETADRFALPASNILEFPTQASDQGAIQVLSHGERVGDFAGATVSLVSCGRLAEAEECVDLIETCENDPDAEGCPTNCVRDFTTPIVLMYEGVYEQFSVTEDGKEDPDSHKNWYQKGGKQYFFFCPNSVEVACT